MKRTQFIVTTGMLILCAIVLTVVFAIPVPSNNETTAPTQSRPAPMVSVTRMAPAAHTAIIRSHGEVRPRWQTTLRNRVDGTVSFLAETMQPGSRVKHGELLLAINPVSSRARVADARNAVASAELQLLTEQAEADSARSNWQRANLEGTPASPLTLRTPMVNAAEAALDAAKALLADAEKQLNNTRITAPFDATIVERTVNPGDSLFVGDPIAVLYATTPLEITISLDQRQWALLPSPIIGATATLHPTTTSRGDTEHANTIQWSAQVVRQGGIIDSETRLRTLHLEITTPTDPKLLPGTFVTVNLPGRKHRNTLAIPTSAYTQSGQIWTVDDSRQLVPIELPPLFYQQNHVYLDARSIDITNTALTIALLPDGAFKDGMTVTPQLSPETLP